MSHLGRLKCSCCPWQGVDIFWNVPFCIETLVATFRILNDAPASLTCISQATLGLVHWTHYPCQNNVCEATVAYAQHMPYLHSTQTPRYYIGVFQELACGVKCPNHVTHIHVASTSILSCETMYHLYHEKCASFVRDFISPITLFFIT